MSMIVDAFVSKLLDGLASVKDEVARVLGVADEIARLQETLQTIKAVLADAERKKIQSEAINNWLKKLKDVMYDADDILDECRFEAEKSKVATSSRPQPSSYFSVGMSVFKKMRFTHQIDRRIHELNQRLENILAEKSKFDLQLFSAGRDDHQSTSKVSRMTSSIPEPDIVGSNVEQDTGKVVELLIKEDTRENILIYAIVGVGGIGKTTLARRIFNDERITANFPMKLWVCVSKDFEETSLLKDIITWAGGSPGGASSRAQLEPMVGEAVTNKKFLLVLDDSWDQNVWNDLLRNPLQSGATGSRILVTTRNEGVALQMKAVESHQVKLLSAEDGWVLLRKVVVLSGQEREIEDLKDIGEKIVDKCGRLPLAIKTVGGVLSRKSRNKKDWEMVLKTLSNNAWSSLTDFPKEVQPALYLSYEDLPSHLKQCFLYCSMFPEDYTFYRRDLIRYWISEGFIHEEGDLTLEELGEDCYGDLVQRSFLQPVPWPDDDEHSKCTVHDLLWSLARFLAGDENFFVKDGFEAVNSSSSVKRRRLWGRAKKEQRQEFIDALEGHNSLRTLVLRLEGSQVEENDVHNLIKKTPRLRVLHFLSSNIIKLPGSLGNLIHLRHLDLRSSQISELPESIENLVNLQFLILQSCGSLRNLPKGIGKLHNLRCLDLFATELEGIPIEIANLHRLNTLIHFVIRNNNSSSGCCTLEELKSLQKLKVLRIRQLERALNEGAVTGVNALRDMLQLEVLHLDWKGCSLRLHKSDHYSEEETKRIEEIFEVTLHPPPCLESLEINFYFGLRFPSWIASSSMDSLRRLKLSFCDKCPQLPPLGKLPNLDYLKISWATAVKKIGTEFLGQGPDSSRDQGGRIQISFPKLTTLIFEYLHNWEEWEWEVKDDDRPIVLPNLKVLKLMDCPKLRSLPSGLVHHATTLTELEIVGACAIKKIGTEFLGQEPDCSRDQGGRIQISFPKLTKLIFAGMFNWEEWEWEVKHDDRLIALPNLKQLTLCHCPKLRSLPSGLVHHATSLTKLEISSCDNLREIRGLSSIKELEISYSRNLEGVSDLPSLKTLALGDDKMQSIPEWLHDFPALNKLEITAGTQLLRRCLKNGLDWTKIEHIPNVYAKNFNRSRYISKSPSAFSTSLNDNVEDEYGHTRFSIRN
ncbi:putative disease resistance protein RGA3 [Elaeis guineensis]